MRRALIALAGTAAGTSLLLGFKSGQLVLPWMDPPPLLPPLTSAAAAGPGAGAGGGAGAGAGDADAGQPADDGQADDGQVAGGADAGAGAGGAAAGSGLKDGSFTGDSVDATYGNVQIKITVTAGKITEVTAVELPNVESRSKDINKRQVPQLRQAALAAQSADFDAVSGASYTSKGYKTSLQSAIDAAKQG